MTDGQLLGGESWDCNADQPPVPVTESVAVEVLSMQFNFVCLR